VDLEGSRGRARGAVPAAPRARCAPFWHAQACGNAQAGLWGTSTARRRAVAPRASRSRVGTAALGPRRGAARSGGPVSERGRARGGPAALGPHARVCLPFALFAQGFTAPRVVTDTDGCTRVPGGSGDGRPLPRTGLAALARRRLTACVVSPAGPPAGGGRGERGHKCRSVRVSAERLLQEHRLLRAVCCCFVLLPHAPLAAPLFRLVTHPHTPFETPTGPTAPFGAAPHGACPAFGPLREGLPGRPCRARPGADARGPGPSAACRGATCSSLPPQRFGARHLGGARALRRACRQQKDTGPRAPRSNAPGGTSLPSARHPSRPIGPYPAPGGTRPFGERAAAHCSFRPGVWHSNTGGWPPAAFSCARRAYFEQQGAPSCAGVGRGFSPTTAAARRSAPSRRGPFTPGGLLARTRTPSTAPGGPPPTRGARTQPFLSLPYLPAPPLEECGCVHAAPFRKAMPRADACLPARRASCCMSCGRATLSAMARRTPPGKYPDTFDWHASVHHSPPIGRGALATRRSPAGVGLGAATWPRGPQHSRS
jgi:hypothetical protein